MVVDTETTGLPAARNANPVGYHAYDNARIVQIAWALYNEYGELQSNEVYLIKPDGFVVPEFSTRIHGISNEEALRDGVSITDMFMRLYYALRNVKTLVAHNMAFDYGIILSEMYRVVTESMHDESVSFTNGLINMWLEKERKCTMLMAHVPGQRWSKLVDLYLRLFGEVPQGTLHRADVDVEACARVYFRLISES